MSNTEKIKVHCNSCIGNRWHWVLFQKEQHYEEGKDDTSVPPYYENHTYSVVECCGCENITLIDDVHSSAVGGTYTEYYPPQTYRKEPEWMFELLMGEQIENPYKYEFVQEIYIALKSNMPRLAVIGIRALLEQIMIESVGDNKNFAKNLDEFEKQGYISKKQREAIDPVIEAGHASIHRGFKASKKEVIGLMDITENIIESIYINEIRVQNVSVPERKNKPHKVINPND